MAGLLLSFCKRWQARPDACALIPYDRFFTGRVPNPEDYPFPFMSLIPGSSRQVYRSDIRQGFRRVVSVHIWVDPARLEEDGERAMEHVRQIYANRAWSYDQGRVIDVIDGGPPTAHQINEATFQAWELVRLLSLCIEQDRVDTEWCWDGQDGSQSGSLSGSSSVSSSSGGTLSGSLASSRSGSSTRSSSPGGSFESFESISSSRSSSISDAGARRRKPTISKGA
jgi:hypothetical protein